MAYDSEECLVKLMEWLDGFLSVLLRMKMNLYYHIGLMYSAYMTLHMGSHVS